MSPTTFTCATCGKTFGYRCSLISHRQRAHTSSLGLRLLPQFTERIVFNRNEEDGLFHCLCEDKAWKDPKSLSKHVKSCASVFRAVLDHSLEVEVKDPASLSEFRAAVEEGLTSLQKEPFKVKVLEHIPSDYSEDESAWNEELWSPQFYTFQSLYPDYKELGIPLPLLNHGFHLHAVVDGFIIFCLRCKLALDKQILLDHIESKHPEVKCQYQPFTQIYSLTHFLVLDEVYNLIDELTQDGFPFPPVPGLDVIKNCYLYNRIIFRTKEEFVEHLRAEKLELMSALMYTTKVDVQILKFTGVEILAIVDLNVLSRPLEIA